MRPLAALLTAALLPAAAHAQIQAAAFGHEYRQDDLPAIAAAPDGSIWAAFLSFAGDRDDIGIRRYKDGSWGALQWLPNTSGDSWLPQLGVDGAGRVWVVWSQQVNGNWDLYARAFDPAKQFWGPVERLTSDPLPDINPRLASGGNGRFALAWQGYRGKNSNIFVKTFDGQKWSADTRVTNHTSNDWEPAVAMGANGEVWAAWDTYRAGNYDVIATQVGSGKEIAVAATPLFEARATIALDRTGQPWIAWEEGAPNWGKDQGYVIRDRAPGVQLGGVRRARVARLESGRVRETSEIDFGVNAYAPHVFSDGRGSVWLIANTRRLPASARRNAGPPAPRGYFEYWAAHLGGGGWSAPVALPESKGRSSTRVNATLAPDGKLWAAWSTDNRVEGLYHRPLRQQVYAAALPAPATEGSPATRDPQSRNVTAKPGHADEAGDLKVLRAHVAQVGSQKLRIVRGDFHRHTELSWDGGGAGDGSLQDFYRYMIDAAAMDFGASTDHQGGAWPYWWWYTQKMTDMFHVPGGYVPIFGYERSATFPNGHRNMFFARRSDSRVTPFFLKTGAPQYGLPRTPMGDEPGIGAGDLIENDTKMLYEEIRSRNALAISHTSGTRMGTDWRDNDPALEPVVEIYQGARTNYEQLGAPLVVNPDKEGPHVKAAGYQPEGMVSNAWAKGYKLGIIASSDHGSTHISYAMVYTDTPTRQGILDAIRKRHTYGAMDNILLDVRMGRHFMGDEFPLNKALPIRVKARGTRPLARVDVIKDSKIVYSATPNRQDVELEFTDRESVSGRHYYYVRVQQDDSMLAWSSPFFVNYQ